MMQLTSCFRAVDGKFQGRFFAYIQSEHSMQPLTMGNWFQREGGFLFLPNGFKHVRGDLEIVVGRLKGGGGGGHE